MEKDFVPYKNRTLDYEQPVEIYRNLNKQGVVYSIRQFGKVVAHTKSIILKRCDLVVNESGRQYVIKHKTKIVHAFVRGYIANMEDILLTYGHILRYNPYKFDKFYTNTSGALTSCRIVYTQGDKLYAQI